LGILVGGGGDECVIEAEVLQDDVPLGRGPVGIDFFPGGDALVDIIEAERAAFFQPGEESPQVSGGEILRVIDAPALEMAREDPVAAAVDAVLLDAEDLQSVVLEQLFERPVRKILQVLVADITQIDRLDHGLQGHEMGDKHAVRVELDRH
jgi:hypothetical protein